MFFRRGMGCVGCGMGMGEEIDFTDEGSGGYDVIDTSAAAKHAALRNKYFSVALGWYGSISVYSRPSWIAWTSGRGIPDADDQRIVTAVKRYQQMKGLSVDGILGPATFAALTGRVPKQPAISIIVPGAPTPSKEELNVAYKEAGKIKDRDKLKTVLIASGAGLVLLGLFLLRR